MYKDLYICYMHWQNPMVYARMHERALKWQGLAHAVKTTVSLSLGVTPSSTAEALTQHNMILK